MSKFGHSLSSLSLGSIRSALLSPLLVGLPIALSGCAGDDEVPALDFGSVSLEVKLAEGVELGELGYSVNGTDLLGQTFSKSGRADLSRSGLIKLQIGGIPPGRDYELALTGSGAAVDCAGAALFDMEADEQHELTVQLQCRLSRDGSIVVNGETNICPLVQQLSVLPLQVEVGGVVQLATEVKDVDGAPDPLSYDWSASAGLLGGLSVSAEGARATLTCTEVGDVTVTLQATDGDCQDTVMAVVTCGEDSSGPQFPLVWNEVESNGGTPDDWAELHNAGTEDFDLTGYVFEDNDDGHVYAIAPGTVVAAGGYLILEDYGFGLGSSDSIRLFDPEMNLVLSYSWEGHAQTTYGRCPNPAGDWGLTTNPTKGSANDCTPRVVWNEVESSGGTPGDWAELYNLGDSAADLGGYVFKDDDDGHSYVLPVGTSVASGGYLVLEEGRFGFGLGGSDAVRLFAPDGALVAEYAWEGHAQTTYGRCPDVEGGFATTLASTKGAANECPVDGEAATTWPGSLDVLEVDAANSFPTNLSGLHYEPGSGSSAAVLWGALNGPSKIYRLVESGGAWLPEAGDYEDGKLLAYPDGTGQPDTEGVTRAEWDSTAVYVSAERNNEASSTSRLSVLRYDWTATGSPIAATHEWDLTAQLPSVGANQGLEAITWIPDSLLTSAGFVDELLGKGYEPADYPDHGSGLFVVGVEGTGALHVLALDHVAGGASIISTVASGHVATMGLEFDRDSGALWAICDDTCQGESTVLSVDQIAGSPTQGRFVVQARFGRPEGLHNGNNEGFAFATMAECSADARSVFWADDSNYQSHALRQGELSCGELF